MPFDPVELTAIQRTLLDAAKLVRKGWCQGSFRDRGNVCALEAIVISGEEHGDSVSAVDKFQRHVGGAVMVFNDSPDRSAEEVAQALEQAAFDGLD